LFISAETQFIKIVVSIVNFCGSLEKTILRLLGVGEIYMKSNNIPKSLFWMAQRRKNKHVIIIILRYLKD
jgi:hypothetical protein